MTTKVVTLSNGIRVLMVQNPAVQSVSVGAFVNVGSRNETKRQSGISHFLEHMAFKGTTTRDYLDISSDIERLGAEMNAYTSKDRTAYYMSGLSQHMPIFVELVGDILCNSVFPEDEIECERNVIIQEYEKYQDSPSSIAYQLADVGAFGDTPAGRAIIGTKANIKRFTRDELMGYMKQYYTGSNMIVAIAGNFDEAQAVQLVERHFGKIEKGTPNQAPTATYKGGFEMSKRSFKQTQILMCFPTKSLKENYYADMVAGSVLGGGMSSPLFNEIREKRGLAYSVWAFSHIQDDIGQLYVSAGTTAEHLPEFFKATCEVIKAHATSVNAIDLERAKNGLLVEQIRSCERPFKLATAMVEDLFMYGEIKPLQEFIDGVQAVTEQDVRDSIARIITAPPTVAIVGKGASDTYLADVVNALR